MMSMMMMMMMVTMMMMMMMMMMADRLTVCLRLTQAATGWPYTLKPTRQPDGNFDPGKPNQGQEGYCSAQSTRDGQKERNEYYEEEGNAGTAREVMRWFLLWMERCVILKHKAIFSNSLLAFHMCNSVLGVCGECASFLACNCTMQSHLIKTTAS